MKLNEQISRMRQMFSSINENNFEKKEYMKYQYNDLEIEVNDHSTTDADIDLYLIKGKDEYEVYRLSIDYDYDEGEPQTYDYPGVSPHVSGWMFTRGYELNEDGEEARELTKFELDSLHHDGTISHKIEGVLDGIFSDHYDNDDYNDYDDYDRDEW